MEVFIGSSNKQLISNYLDSPSHGLIIIATANFGKSIIMTYIASKLLGTENLANNPSYKLVQTDENSIGIDDIREVQKYLKLKQGTKNGGTRVIVIKDCHKMTVEAQNSFLKLLEEPPDKTYLLMSAENTSTLLPTIKSRARVMALKPYDKKEVCDYFVGQGYVEKEVERYYIMTDGLVGAMHDLLEDRGKQEAFDQAKTLLSGSLYQRLIIVDGLSKDKAVARDLLYALRRTLLATLHSGKLSNEQAKKIHKSLSAVIDSEDMIAKGNPNLKLVLSNMMLSM